MSVTIRPYKTGGWEVDIHVILPNGTRARSRTRKHTSKSAAHRWGLSREREWLVGRPKTKKEVPAPQKEVPTLEGFAERFVDGYARANRQKPSGIAAKQMILRVHLIPRLGTRRLDAIGNEHVQRLKHSLRTKAAKTVNNVLTVLNVLLKTAVEWDVIEQMPCTIRLLRVPKTSASFHDFDDFERLVDTARETDWQTHLIVLLGGEAGLVRKLFGAIALGLVLTAGCANSVPTTTTTTSTTQLPLVPSTSFDVDALLEELEQQEQLRDDFYNSILRDEAMWETCTLYVEEHPELNLNIDTFECDEWFEKTYGDQ